MSTGGFRSVVFRLHKWIGLNIAILFGLIFLSGVVLLAADEIEALTHPKLWASAPAPGQAADFGTIYESVHRAYPDANVYVIQRQPRPWLADRSYITTAGGEKLVVWTDPANGSLRDTTSDENFRALAKELHERLLVPGRRAGRLAFIAVTATSALLLYLAISGLITYRRFWKGFFRRPTRSLGARGYQGGLHRLLGVWTSLFLLIISVTGLYFFANGLGINGYTPRPRQAQERPAALPAGFGAAAINKAEALARAALPGFAPTTLVLPAYNRAGIIFAGYGAGAGPTSGENTVAVDPVTDEILGVIRPADSRGIARLRGIVNALHFGQWGGTFSRVLWGLFGLLGSWMILAGVRTYTARAAHLTDGRQKGGGLRRFFRGMGLFGWANLALLAAVVAFAILRFGH